MSTQYRCRDYGECPHGCHAKTPHTHPGAEDTTPYCEKEAGLFIMCEPILDPDQIRADHMAEMHVGEPNADCDLCEK